MKIVVDKLLLNYQDEGSGPTLLLLHGWGTNLQTFDAMVTQLTQKYRVIRFDFPGFGQSSVPPEDWKVDDYAKLTLRFLEKINAGHLHGVLAHSFGGRIAIRLIARHQFQPEVVILMGAAGIKPEVSPRRTLVTTVAKAGKTIMRLPGLARLQPLFRERLYNSIGSHDYLDAGTMQPVFLNVINEDLTSEISFITQPSLLLWGENDQETPIRDGEKMHALIKSSRLVILPEAGHFVYLDSPERTMEEIEKALT